MDKILFITIVPPFPDDQGNRVVTKSYMDYFLKLGYELDVIVQCDYDEERVREYYGKKVAMYKTGQTHTDYYPKLRKWREEIRREAFSAIENVPDQYEKAMLKDIYYAANHRHPFSRISDETINICDELVKKEHYRFIVCNYTCTLRAVHELRKKYTLPTVIVITHDALSRLDDEAYFYGISTYGLACNRKTELECLNEADVICAISKYEKNYFKVMNPSGKVILVEYPGWNSEKKTVSENNFENKQIIFFAGQNQQNEKGIKDFLEFSWLDIKRQVPSVSLMIAGNICNKIKTDDEAVILAGTLSDEELWEHISESTLGINPVYIGTGLKIKSVDMMCAGLPFVTFNTGVEGMEEVDNKAFVIVKDWNEFTERTIALLENYEKWNDLRMQGGNSSRIRFSPDNTYRELTETILEL